MFQNLSIESVLHLMQIVATILGFGTIVLGGFKFFWSMDARIVAQAAAASAALELTSTRVTGLLELRGQKIDALSEDMSDIKEEIKKLNEVTGKQAAIIEMINSLRRDYDVLRDEVRGMRKGEGFIVPPPVAHKN